MALIDDIAARHGSPDAAARAPGRVNLIGDHVDYCGGLVMPFAIDRDCVCAIIEGETDRDAIVLSSLNEDKEHRVTLADAVQPGVGAARGSWQSYVLGAIAGIEELGALDALGGCRVAVATDVPLGAGLSSSASLEVSVALAAASRCGVSVGGLELAKLCQKAEHEFAGVPCGLMDQAISVLGRSGHVVMLDCSDESTRTVAVPADSELVVINSGVKHALADGEYGQRRAVCERAAAEIGVEHLAHADLESTASLDAEAEPLARHVVSETGRVRLAAERLAAGDLAGCGTLMYESHASLRDDFRVSCSEIDAIVETLRGVPSVFGARMTGGGFGGCVIALTTPGAFDTVAAAVEAHRTICPDLAVMRVRASAGAALL